MYKRKAASLSAAFVCGAAASEYGFMLLFYTICGLPLLAYIDRDILPFWRRKEKSHFPT